MFDSGKASITTTIYEFANDAISSAESTETQVVFLHGDKAIDMQAYSKWVYIATKVVWMQTSVMCRF